MATLGNTIGSEGPPGQCGVTNNAYGIQEGGLDHWLRGGQHWREASGKRGYWSLFLKILLVFLLKGGIRRLSLCRDRKGLGEKIDCKPDISWFTSFPSFTAI